VAQLGPVGNKFVAQLALSQYELGDKFVAHIGAGRQDCRPSRAELGLKDWANNLRTKEVRNILLVRC
jgi:hypothetical protein